MKRFFEVLCEVLLHLTVFTVVSIVYVGFNSLVTQAISYVLLEWFSFNHSWLALFFILCILELMYFSLNLAMSFSTFKDKILGDSEKGAGE